MNRLTTLMMTVTVGAMLSGCGSVPGFSRVRAPNLCQDRTVSIYFERDSAAITREARAVLKGAGDMAKGCVLGQVDVTGLADAVGDPEANLTLSRTRAETVRKAVERLGFSTVNFKVGAVGESGAMTDGGADKPLRRRADVTFRLRPH